MSLLYKELHGEIFYPNERSKEKARSLMGRKGAQGHVPLYLTIRNTAQLPSIRNGTDLDAMTHVLALVGAAVTVQFAVAMGEAIPCTVLVSVNVVSADMVLAIFVAALKIFGALVAGLDAFGTLARGCLHPGLREVGSSHGLGGAVELAITGGILAAVLGLDGARIVNFHALGGGGGADAGSLTDGGCGSGVVVLLPVAELLVDVDARLDIDLLLDPGMLELVVGDGELDVDGKKAVVGIVVEGSHLELDDAEGLVDGGGEAAKVGHLELSVLAGVADALAPELGVLDVVAVDDHVGLLGVGGAELALGLLLLTLLELAAAVHAPVLGVVVFPVLVVDDVDAQLGGAGVMLVDGLVLVVPEGDGSVLFGVEAELPDPEVVVVAADGLANLEAGDVALLGRLDAPADAFVGVLGGDGLVDFAVGSGAVHAGGPKPTVGVLLGLDGSGGNRGGGQHGGGNEVQSSLHCCNVGDCKLIQLCIEIRDGGGCVVWDVLWYGLISSQARKGYKCTVH